MYQSKLEIYFPSLSPPRRCGRNFLDLPYNIRDRIYRLAGVVHTCPIYLGSGPQWYPNTRYRGETPCCSSGLVSHLECDCVEYFNQGCYQPIPVSLLCCSQDISREVSSLFYRENRFHIQYTGSGSFTPFMQMRQTTVARIRYLQVVLHRASKDSPHYECRCWDSSERRPPVRRMPPRHYRNVVTEWKAVCAQLAGSIAPFQLQMCLLCDTDDGKVAADVLYPLHQLPLLAGFSVRLASPQYTWRKVIDRSPLVDLHRMAMQTSMQITGRACNPQRQTFRYDLLPVEIQLRILEHTDLVGPGGYLAFNFGQGFSPIRAPNLHHRLRPEHCQLCYTIRTTCCLPRFPAGGTWVSQCPRCWKFPLSLFLVNRHFHQEATRIFWSLNQFIILDLDPDYVDEDMTGPFPPLLAPVNLTTAMPSHALRYLRYLHFSLALPYGSGLKTMHETVRALQQRGADLPRLTITLDYSGLDAGIHSYEADSPNLERRNQICWELYSGTAAEFVPLRGLKGFFVRVRTDGEWLVFLDHQREEWERRLETIAMGGSYRSEEVVKQAAFAWWYNPYTGGD